MSKTININGFLLEKEKQLEKHLKKKSLSYYLNTLIFLSILIIALDIFRGTWFIFGFYIILTALVALGVFRTQYKTYTPSQKRVIKRIGRIVILILIGVLGVSKIIAKATGNLF